MPTLVVKRQPPWDRDSTNPHLGCLFYGCATVMFSTALAGLVIFVVVNAASLLLHSPLSLFEKSAVTMATLVALGLLLVLVRRLNRGHLAYSLRLSSSSANIIFHRANWLTVVEGDGNAIFHEYGMELTGNIWVREDLLGFSWYVPLVALSIILGPESTWPVRIIYVSVGSFLLLIDWVFWRVARKRVATALAGVSTVTALPKHVQRVRCIGSTVFIKFCVPPVPGLRRIAFYVAPSFRDDFFQKFNQLFPKTLPKAYRDALESEAESIEQSPGI